MNILHVKYKGRLRNFLKIIWESFKEIFKKVWENINEICKLGIYVKFVGKLGYPTFFKMTKSRMKKSRKFFSQMFFRRGKMASWMNIFPNRRYPRWPFSWMDSKSSGLCIQILPLLIHKIFLLQAPVALMPAIYQLRVLGVNSNGMVLFNQFSNLTYDEKFVSVVFQTTRPIYSSGQTSRLITFFIIMQFFCPKKS